MLISHSGNLASSARPATDDARACALDGAKPIRACGTGRARPWAPRSSARDAQRSQDLGSSRFALIVQGSLVVPGWRRALPTFSLPLRSFRIKIFRARTDFPNTFKNTPSPSSPPSSPLLPPSFSRRWPSCTRPQTRTPADPACCCTRSARPAWGPPWAARRPCWSPTARSPRRRR